MLDKVDKKKVLRRVNEDSKYWTLFGKGNIDGLAVFWDITDFCMKLLNTEWEVNQQEGMVWYGVVWYGIVEFNIPLDTV